MAQPNRTAELARNVREFSARRGHCNARQVVDQRLPRKIVGNVEEVGINLRVYHGDARTMERSLWPGRPSDQ